MGNSVPSSGQKQLASFATIKFGRQEYKENSGGHRERRSVSYKVDGSLVALLMLDRIFGEDGGDKGLRFQFNNLTRSAAIIFFFIDRAENDLLQPIKFDGMGGFHDSKFVNETDNPSGGVTKTSAFFHGYGKGLLLVEEKRRSGDRLPCAVTVAHHYAVGSGNDSSQRDIGLSMVAHVGVSNNKYLLSVEGPVQHPSVKTLLHMFQEVSRTRTCPLYAETQRQRRAMYVKFETETESDEDTGNLLPVPLIIPRQNGGTILANQSYGDRGNLLLPARLHGPGQNGASILSNQGAIRGNNNGNFHVNQMINLYVREGYT